MALRKVLGSTPLLLRPENSFGLLNCYLGVLNRRSLHIGNPLLKKQEVSIVIERDGQEMTARGKEGDSVLDVVVNNKIELSGYGACEGTLACSTCHVILSSDDYNRVSEKASDEELDMLDLAPDACETSRLGCQVFLTKSMEGLKVKVPSAIKDMREFPESVIT